MVMIMNVVPAIMRQTMMTTNIANVATPHEEGNNKQTVHYAYHHDAVDDDDDSIDDDDHRHDDVGDDGGSAIIMMSSLRFVSFASHFASFRSSDRLIPKHFTRRRKLIVIQAVGAQKCQPLTKA